MLVLRTTMSRGPHSSDTVLFAPDQCNLLRTAVRDLAWLLARGYAEPSALKLVGDRHALRQRQREAVRRGVCTPAQHEARVARRCSIAALRGRAVAVDAFNCLITLESAFSGGVLIRGLDGVLRDLASVHGSYRRNDATHLALDALARLLAASGAAKVRWFVDRPVSNSGRLRQWILERACAGMVWEVELPHDADRAMLAEQDDVLASADAFILDRAAAWVDLCSAIVPVACPDAWIVDLTRAPEHEARA